MIKELVVISGKGGTGKTSIVAALANLVNDKVLADCDVDAADLHLVLNPTLTEQEEFWSGKSASINSDKCTRCGKCLELCRYGAISKDFVIDKVACEGCGVCYYFCPAEAIDFTENMCGHMYVSTTSQGPMVHARLGIAEENSGKLVTMVRNKAREIAEEKDLDTILIDGPPGIGCPVIASITGANFVIAVTEPTLSGIHDLERVAGLAKHFDIPLSVIINKADINKEMSQQIKDKCHKMGINVLGEIPYDEAITKAQIQGLDLIRYDSASPAAEVLKNIASDIKDLLPFSKE